MANTISIFALWALILTSVLISLLYLVRVVRNSRDPLRWALLGVILSLALTNAPVLFFYYGNRLPFGVGATLRIFALISLVVTTFPLIRDTWREVCATLRVARDSWRLFSPRD
jgi:hypothetical protein